MGVEMKELIEKLEKEIAEQTRNGREEVVREKYPLDRQTSGISPRSDDVKWNLQYI